ncbi:MAG: ArsR family transcriptional regulator, partial [Lachnoanaerobaculum gingivalis]
GVNQSTVSQHLAKLRDIGIVGCLRDGQTINYYLKNEEVKKIVKLMFEENKNE